jgi:hypothetical protein
VSYNQDGRRTQWSNPWISTKGVDIMKEVPPIVIHDNEFVTVWYHPDKKIVHHQFHKFLYDKAFRDALNAGVEAMQKYGAEKWLSDDRQNGAIPEEDLEWGRSDWFPRVKAAGWKYWAIVPPEKTIGRLNMQREAQINNEKGVITGIFNDPDEAMTWLASQ